MAIEQRSVLVHLPPSEALDLSVQALENGRFKDVQLDRERFLISARRKPGGQWTRGQITISVTPTQEGSRVTAHCEEVAQSLYALASNPAHVLVTRFLDNLEQLIGIEELPSFNLVRQSTSNAGISSELNLESNVVVPPAYRFCPACGGEVSPDSRFCGDCGRSHSADVMGR
jgi:hypothetical protein